MRDNTLVVVTGDNGGTENNASKDHPRGLFGPNLDPRTGQAFRGTKGKFYEGGIRTIEFANWPGHVKPGVTDLLCSFTDMMPTLAELSGAKTPDVADGISLAPTLLGKPGQKQHEWLYWGINERACAVRIGNWKGLRSGTKWELYDLATDIGEARDVAAQHPDIIEKMRGIEKQAYTPMRPGEIVDHAILRKDRFSNSARNSAGQAEGNDE